jgi:homocysteine S-methyltransferase
MPKKPGNITSSKYAFLATPTPGRIRGLRANASAKSHAALNDSSELDEGNAVGLGVQYRGLAGKLSRLNVLGGCCGTDHRHVEEICKACLTH